MLTPWRATFCRRKKQKTKKKVYIIPPHWHDTGSWNPSSCKTRTYWFYSVNIAGADVLATQGATASATVQSPWNLQVLGPRLAIEGWPGKWSICRSCWTRNKLWELLWFLVLRHANDLQNLQFKYFCGFSGLHGLQSFCRHCLDIYSVEME